MKSSSINWFRTDTWLSLFIGRLSRDEPASRSCFEVGCDI